jgi:hypothetical protein
MNAADSSETLVPICHVQQRRVSKDSNCQSVFFEAGSGFLNII